ncbi:sensor histidine kinase [Massilia sp. DWR3-1-1]|uniref:sensor histidine kinase n=1 Tax=Massilia sp. DWR3-1-1 TaxID=2804559 RepID=UPI003CEBBE10
MFASLFFIARLSVAWFLLYLPLAIFTHEVVFRHNGSDGFIVAMGALLVVVTITGAFSHVNRVRLIAGHVTASALSRRQRRQVELPLEAGEAFDLVDAAMRELPGVRAVESARDSLQSRVRITRVNPYPGDSVSWRWITNLHSLRNQVSMTVTPNGDAGSVMLICEPERAAWTDWLFIDYGTNLETAEALSRAIARRVAERRRTENLSAAESATEKALTVAKLSLLHAQVEPHFLYNTLASAQILTRSDPARADAMLGNLITYLRHSLPRTGDDLSTLGVELERAHAYLDILKIRMGSRLQLQVDVPAPLRQLAFPPMMLQTLVENAIKHGLEPQSGGGTVWILARQLPGDALMPFGGVAVTVADDGRGFSSEGGGTGIGLRNVRERLRLAYGAGATFNIVANFPAGVAATISVPGVAP